MYETVIRSAVNYDLIVNYKCGNFITKRIKEFYLELIKANDEAIIVFDTIVGCYFENEDFRDFLYKNLDKYEHPIYGIDYFYGLADILKESYDDFQSIQKIIEKTKWI